MDTNNVRVSAELPELGHLRFLLNGVEGQHALGIPRGNAICSLVWYVLGGGGGGSGWVPARGVWVVWGWRWVAVVGVGGVGVLSWWWIVVLKVA